MFLTSDTEFKLTPVQRFLYFIFLNKCTVIGHGSQLDKHKGLQDFYHVVSLYAPT